MTDIHVSLDLETLSTRPDAAVLSIGAATRVNGELSTFIGYCGEGGQLHRHVDAATLNWWKKRGALWDEIHERHKTAPDMEVALDNLQAWIVSLGNDDDQIFVWGNGASFDVAILEHAYKTCRRSPPWAFWNVRDLRTLKHMAENTGRFTKPQRPGTHHDARDDAVYQLMLIEHSLGCLTTELAGE